MLVDDRVLSEHAARIESLLQEVQSFPNPAMRQKAAEIVETLLMLYGEGLARMMECVDTKADREASDRIFTAFAEDELISHLLCLHDLHPVSVETRVARALEEVRPYLESHGGNVELLGIDGGIARIRLQGSCSGCPSSTVTLKLAIEEAIHKAAPDLDGIEAEGVIAPPPGNFIAASDLIVLRDVSSPEAPHWVAADGVGEIAEGESRVVQVSGLPLLFLRSDETLYAYRNACPSCGKALDEGVLGGTALTCAGCGHRFDVCRAGRGLDAPDLHLDPVPLLIRGTSVNVALGQ